MDYIRRYLSDPVTSFFLLGPRGTGKTWWVNHTFPQALILDLLNPEVYRTYASRPERLIELVAGNPSARQIVLDEIQKIPEMLEVVHLLMERHPDLQFILTGSSARKIRRAGVDLLAGRAIQRTIHPFMASELGKQFDMEQALRIGLLPVVIGSRSPEEAIRGYVTLYLEEEVRAEGLVRKIGDFARFLEAVSFSHGSVLSISNVARECEIGRKTVEGYVAILEDLLLAHRIPVFSRRATRRITTHPKFYLFDSGVFRSLRSTGPLDHPGEIDGAALEGLVLQHLIAWNQYGGNRNQLHFWRTPAGSEIDFILYGEDGLIAVEVKNARTVHPSHLRSLKTFRTDYPECVPILLYRGQERLQRDGIQIIPCGMFLAELIPGKVMPGV